MAGGGLPNVQCTPSDPTCHAATSVCLPLANNLGTSKFGLRMADLTFIKPSAFTQGIVQNVLRDAVTPKEPVCNLAGNGTFSWLLEFDKTAGTLKTGGAKPPAMPALGYSFVDEVIPPGTGLHAAPITLSGPVDASCGFSSLSGDLILPVYLDAQAMQVIVLPIRKVHFSMGKLSSDYNCIGAYNAQGLTPANGCTADNLNPLFLDAAQVGGFISLEEADQVIISALSQSLCVLLSGNPGIFGNGATPNRCKRNASNQIVYQGDWCAATNMGAAGGCADAAQLTGNFAASAVKIN